jgi:hypothetical protein
MKIDFFDAGTDGSPILRLSDFSVADAKCLHAAFAKLAAGQAETLNLSEIVVLEPSNHWAVTFRRGKRDLGVTRSSAQAFNVELSCIWWDNVAGLVEPFGDDLTGYQWLVEGRIRLLLSPAGEW